MVVLARERPPTFSRGEGAEGSAATVGGRGMRETQLETKKCKDLLKSTPLGCLMALTARYITARIPHPSSKLPWALGIFESTFPRGKVRAFGAKKNDKPKFELLLQKTRACHFSARPTLFVIGIAVATRFHQNLQHPIIHFFCCTNIFPHNIFFLPR